MRNDTKIHILLQLFFSMLKIGLFTFGGGYAMLSILEDEFIERKKWITKEEFLDMTAIAESTPGPIAINSSTYIGYKVGKAAGSVIATLGVCIPSFVIIFVISLFFDRFLSLTLISYAFKGIRACVVWLILSAGIKMLKSIKKDILSLTLFSLTLVLTVIFDIMSVDFSSVFFILSGGILGLVSFSVISYRARRKADKK